MIHLPGVFVVGSTTYSPICVLMRCFPPNDRMDMFPCDLTQYQSTSAVEKLMKKTGEDKATESLLVKNFKELGSPAAEAFIEHPT